MKSLTQWREMTAPAVSDIDEPSREDQAAWQAKQLPYDPQRLQSGQIANKLRLLTIELDRQKDNLTPYKKGLIIQQVMDALKMNYSLFSKVASKMGRAFRDGAMDQPQATGPMGQPQADGTAGPMA